MEMLESDFTEYELEDYGAINPRKQVSFNVKDDAKRQEYLIILEFDTEREQQKHFEKLTGEGIKCKIIN